MISLKQAFGILFSQSICLQTQKVSLFESCGSILAEDIFATRPIPAFSNSAMDGYAIEQIAESYHIQNSIFAGDREIPDILPLHCTKIMTGAKIPTNTLAVIPFEHTQMQNNTIIPTQNIKHKQNIKFCGEDYQNGEKILSKGERLNYASLSLLASQGIHQLLTYQNLKIAIYASGDELKEPWEKIEEHQIYNTNAIAYHSILHEAGFESQYQGILPDNLNILNRQIQDFTQYDIVITSGGASVGEADFFEQALKNNGAQILFHGINLKPGRPMLVAKLQNTLIFSLPGNPLSGSLNLITLVIPALHKLNGSLQYFPQSFSASCVGDLKLKSGRSHIILGHFDGNSFAPFRQGKYGSGSLKPLQSSNALAIFEETISEVCNGNQIQILPIPFFFSKNQKNIFNQNLG